MILIKARGFENGVTNLFSNIETFIAVFTPFFIHPLHEQFYINQAYRTSTFLIADKKSSASIYKFFNIGIKSIYSSSSSEL